MTKRLNWRNVAKMTVACLTVVAAVFISCGKDELGGGSIGGKQSPVGEVGNTFRINGSVPGVSGVTSQITSLDDGISTMAMTATITNPDILNVVAAIPGAEVTGTSASFSRQYRFTSQGIQTIFPEGAFTAIKYDAKKGDVYTLKRGSRTIRREVTKVSNENEFSWNGMKIKTIHVKETGSGVGMPGLDYVEYVYNHKFSLVACIVYFEDGTTLNVPFISNATNS